MLSRTLQRLASALWIAVATGCAQSDNPETPTLAATHAGATMAHAPADATLGMPPAASATRSVAAATSPKPSEPATSQTQSPATPATPAPSLAAPIASGEGLPTPSLDRATFSTTLPVETAVPLPVAVPIRHLIPGVSHVWQKWNNCGPSAVLMALSAHGVMRDQLAIAAELKPDREDTNVTPEEIADYVRAQGYVAMVGLGADMDVVRALVAVGIPVIAEQWIDVDGRGEMGHYRVIIGYDNETQEVVAQDSYYGAARRYGYDELAAMWRPFLGAFVAVARPDQEGEISAVLASRDQTEVLTRLQSQYAADVARSAEDRWGWYGLGETSARLGDYEGAVAVFERAIALGMPTRAFWYQFGYYEALLETGRYDAAVAHADATLATMNGENLEESHYWRGQALMRLDRREEAVASYQRALQFNPLYEPARRALENAGG